MIDPDFAARGWQFHGQANALSRVQVMGERSSGTNFVQRLVGRNTALSATDALGWKHGRPAMIAVPRDVLVVGVVRGALDWARSMHAKPWHCPPEMQLMDFSDFIRAPWATIVDRARYFRDLNEACLGQPLQADRDPQSGAVYADLMALRRGKMAGLLSYAARDCSFALVRLEAVQADPQGFLAALDDGFGVALAPQYRRVVKRLGSRFKPAVAQRPATPVSVSQADQDYITSRLDAPLEASLGYLY